MSVSALPTVRAAALEKDGAGPVEAAAAAVVAAVGPGSKNLSGGDCGNGDDGETDDGKVGDTPLSSGIGSSGSRMEPQRRATNSPGLPT